MSGTIALNQKNVYGAFELKKLYPRNYTLGLVAAVFFHLLLIGFYYFYQATTREDFDSFHLQQPRIIPYNKIGTPPPINIPIQMPSSAHVAPLTTGIPKPVPADQAPVDREFASQDQLSHEAVSSVVTGMGSGDKIIVDIVPVPDPIEEVPPDFVPVEKLPEMVVAPQPAYPEVARRAGITGKVFVKVLVDKEGKPRKAVVVKTDSDLFNQAAIDAVMKSVFTPAIQNHKPIAVWTVLPYNFKLAE